MKNIFNRKNRLGLWILLFVMGTALISSCSKDKDTPASKSHKIIFKATVSDGSTISDAVYGVDTDLTTQSSLKVNAGPVMQLSRLPDPSMPTSVYRRWDKTRMLR